MAYKKPHHHPQDELASAQLADNRVDLACALRDHGNNPDPEWVKYIAGLRRDVTRAETAERSRQRAQMEVSQ